MNTAESPGNGTTLPKTRHKNLQNKLQNIPRMLALGMALGLSLALTLAYGTGCRHSAPGSPASGSGAVTVNPVTITDDAGRQVTVPAPPTRIISLAPSNTETLFALGLGPKVVGVDKFSNYPPGAESVEKVGGFSDPSVEKIAALKPDLVLATSMHQNVLLQLERLGVPVVVLDPRDVPGVLTSIETVGKVAGCPETAKRVVEDIQTRLQKVEAKVGSVPREQRPWVYYEVYSEPIMTVGPRTLIYQLIELAGGRSISYDAQTDYPEFSPEVVIERNPQVIIFPSFHGSASLTVEKLKARPGWGDIKAVKDGRAYPIDADLISRPGPRIGEAVEELAHLILPEEFPR